MIEDNFDDFDHDDFDRHVTRIPQHKKNPLGKSILENATQYWQDIGEAEHGRLIQSLMHLAQDEPYFQVLADELDQPVEAKVANDALNLMHFWQMLEQQNLGNAEGLLSLPTLPQFQDAILAAFDALDIGETKAQRRQVLAESFKLYQLECYAGCIPVLYAQMEGLLTEVLIAQGYLEQKDTRFIDVYKIVPGIKGHEIKSLWHKAKIASELNRYFVELAAFQMDSSSSVTMTRHNMLHGTDVAHFSQGRSLVLFIWLFAVISFMSTVKN